MTRQFDYHGVTWEVELTGTTGDGCRAPTLGVVFRCPETGEVIPGTLSPAGTGRLTDAHLATALDAAIEDREPGVR